MSKPLRGVIAVGGVWIFYYGTSFDVPEGVKGVAFVFAAIGIAAVLYAIFSQKISETLFFYKAAKRGSFPAGVSAGKGGLFIRRAKAKGSKETPGVTSVNAERFFAFAEIKGIEDHGDYYKIILPGEITGVFIFKEDFGKGDPEAFKDFISERHFRS